MTFFYRFNALSISLPIALILMACQPTGEKIDSVTDTEIIAPTKAPVVPADTGNLVNTQTSYSVGDEVRVDDTQMLEGVKEYAKSMSRMHDEMLIGVNYNDPDTAFAKTMLGHHRGAIEMAELELKYGSDNKMHQLAQNSLEAQQLEVDTMNKWLASHPDAPKPKSNTQSMQQAYRVSMTSMYDQMMVGIADPKTDMTFVYGMLPHYVGAVKIATVQLKYGEDKEMLMLAQQIIDTQQPKIQAMQNWIALNETNPNSVDGDSQELAPAT